MLQSPNGRNKELKSLVLLEELIVQFQSSIRDVGGVFAFGPHLPDEVGGPGQDDLEILRGLFCVVEVVDEEVVLILPDRVGRGRGNPLLPALREVLCLQLCVGRLAFLADSLDFLLTQVLRLMPSDSLLIVGRRYQSAPLSLLPLDLGQIVPHLPADHSRFLPHLDVVVQSHLLQQAIKVIIAEYSRKNLFERFLRLRFEEVRLLEFQREFISEGYNIKEDPCAALQQAKFSQLLQQLPLEDSHQVEQQLPLIHHEHQRLPASHQLPQRELLPQLAPEDHQLIQGAAPQAQHRPYLLAPPDLHPHRAARQQLLVPGLAAHQPHQKAPVNLLLRSVEAPPQAEEISLRRSAGHQVGHRGGGPR
jgi:hypothetical protein